MLLLKFEELKAGEIINYTGGLIVMRDAAHKRIKEMKERNEKLPVDFKDKIIFYAGPAKKPDFQAVGSIGPTTSNRMDGFLEIMYQLGISATVGKGKRSGFVAGLNKKYSKVYFVTPSGMAAMLSQKVKKHTVLAFDDLGTEAIQELIVEDFPLMTAIDVNGEDIFDIGG
ncbi:MAG TPA: FumA C-terminus/TtdB family hydratase beta subunit [Tepiditoga sp.]|nr:FumA C-terminus/TtdB family hydratase beta subunit [Tepiditoga sp.]